MPLLSLSRRETPVLSGSIARRTCAWLLVGLLLVSSSGCAYNQHTNFAASEKWVASDVNIVPKVLGSLFLAPIESVFSPFTAGFDYIYYDDQYHADHEYLSYAGSRTIGRSDMGLGYQGVASVFSIIIETAYLPLTGLLDLVYVIWIEEDEPAAHGG